MMTLKNWVHCAMSSSHADAKRFVPLRMTIRGCAGSGKSFMIKSLVNDVRRMFGFKDVVCVVAPTGAAAHNVGGQTVHRRAAVNPHYPSRRPSAKALEEMIKKNKRLLVLIYDERSMLTCDVIGASERHFAESTHGGGHSGEQYGGIPVVIFVGDDYQLPPPSIIHKGAFDTMNPKASFSQQSFNMGTHGATLFHDMSNLCMQLKKVERQRRQEDTFLQHLGRLRVGDTTIQDADMLLNLHTRRLPNDLVNTLNHDPQTMFLFAKKAQRDEHNYSNLARISNQTNPVALIKALYCSTSSRCHRANMRHFEKDSIPQCATICRGAKVALRGRNFEPEWGLFNNAVGTVEEIVFPKGGDPNSGDLPLYVVVRFPQYSGPTWDNKNPKVRRYIGKRMNWGGTLRI